MKETAERLDHSFWPLSISPYASYPDESSKTIATFMPHTHKKKGP